MHVHGYRVLARVRQELGYRIFIVAFTIELSDVNQPQTPVYRDTTTAMFDLQPVQDIRTEFGKFYEPNGDKFYIRGNRKQYGTIHMHRQPRICKGNDMTLSK